MIIRTFNNGWGHNFPLKKYEQEQVDKLLSHYYNSDQHTVVINSVWYSKEYHQTVLEWLRNNNWDNIVIVAMIDAAIPHPDWYAEFGRPVTGIGYYPGVGQMDFWALFAGDFISPPNNLLQSKLVDCAYMCLMRKPHWHRKQLYKNLVSQDVVDKGIVSMGGNDSAVRSLEVDCEHDNLAPNASKDHYGIPNDIASIGHIENWQRCFLNVVAETCFDINQSGFVSEKIYKPIIGCRPFLVYDPDGGAKWLEQRGFWTYVNDFKDISDLDLTVPNNLAPFLKILCNQPPVYWQSKLVDLQSKILYNRTHFYEYVDEQKSIINKGISCQV